MAKRIFLLALVILGSSIYPFQNGSKAIVAEKSASVSEAACCSNAQNKRPPYRVLNSRYVARSNFKKILGPNNEVRIRILQNGIDNTEIEDLSFAYEKGTEYRMGNIYGLENYSLPLYVKVSYRAWNAFHAVQFDVIFEFVIYYPGTWDVNIWN
jgi:hypothetical protein